MKSSYFTLFRGVSLLVLLFLFGFSSPDLLVCLQACQDKLSLNYASELDRVQVKKVDFQLEIPSDLHPADSLAPSKKLD